MLLPRVLRAPLYSCYTGIISRVETEKKRRTVHRGAYTESKCGGGEDEETIDVHCSVCSNFTTTPRVIELCSQTGVMGVIVAEADTAIFPLQGGRVRYVKE